MLLWHIVTGPPLLFLNPKFQVFGDGFRLMHFA